MHAYDIEYINEKKMQETRLTNILFVGVVEIKMRLNDIAKYSIKKCSLLLFVIKIINIESKYFVTFYNFFYVNGINIFFVPRITESLI